MPASVHADTSTPTIAGVLANIVELAAAGVEARERLRTHRSALRPFLAPVLHLPFTCWKAGMIFVVGFVGFVLVAAATPFIRSWAEARRERHRLQAIAARAEAEDEPDWMMGMVASQMAERMKAAKAKQTKG